MRGLLVRIGIDQAYGHWNAPVDPATGQFVYVPIPEKAKAFHPKMITPYPQVLPALQSFCAQARLDLDGDLRFPADLLTQPAHLDPDFGYLTYGNRGNTKGNGISALRGGDLLVFYAGLRPTSRCEHKLLYALVGLYVVDEVVNVTRIPSDRWQENAHTRKTPHWPDDIVVRAKPRVSGRLAQCLPIGEWRSRAYRVRNDVLEAWGGLSVRDGFIQRSAVPPEFVDADRFYKWFLCQKVALLERNN